MPEAVPLAPHLMLRCNNTFTEIELWAREKLDWLRRSPQAGDGHYLPWRF